MPEGIAQAPAFMLSNMSHDSPCTHVRVNHHLVVPIFDLSSGILPSVSLNEPELLRHLRLNQKGQRSEVLIAFV